MLADKKHATKLSRILNKKGMIIIKAKQTVASVLAASLVANMSSILFKFDSIANASSPYSIGYNADDYDVWDGASYDFEWYRNPSEPNNYVIEDADDFAGFLVLSNDYSASSIVLDPADTAYLAQKEDWTGCKFTLNSGVNIAGFEESAAIFGGEFDLNGNIICSSSNLFDTVTADGKIHNGKFTALNKFDALGDPVSTEVVVASENAGIISDIDFSWAESSSNATGCSIVLCNTNTGTISNINAIYGLIACPVITKTNNNLIENCKAILVPETGFVGIMRENRSKPIIGTNNADIKDFEILATSDTPDDNTYYNFLAINENTGVIDNIFINGCTFYTTSNFAIIASNMATGVIKNADINVNFKHPVTGQNANWITFTEKNVGIIEDSEFVINSVPFASSLFHNYGGFTSCDFKNNGVIADSYLENNVVRNCAITVNMEASGSTIANMTGLIYGNTLYNCDVKYTGLKDVFGTHRGAAFKCHIKDCNIDIDYMNNGDAQMEGDIFQGMVQGSNIHIGEMAPQMSGAQFVSLLDSTVIIDKISDCAGDYPLVAYLTKNSNVIIKEATGELNDLVGGRVENSCYDITYSGNFKVYSGGNYGLSVNYFIADSQLYYSFADDAVGEFNTLFDQYDLGTGYGQCSQKNTRIRDSFVYIGAMPSGVATIAPCLLGGVSSDLWGDTEEKVTGLTVIAPHVNVAAVKGLSGGFSIIGSHAPSGGNMRLPNNCYFDVNLYFKNTDNINYVSAVRPDYGVVYRESYNNCFNINVYDSTGAPLDMPVYVYTTNNPMPLYLDVRNTILRSNTKSPQSAIIAFNEDAAGKWTWWLQNPNTVEMVNCVLDLPNAQTASEKPGFVNVQTYTSNTPRDDSVDRVLCGIAQSLGLFNLTDCYAPEGQSGVYRRSSDVDDKLNTYTALQAVYNSADSGNTKNMAVYLVDTLGLSFASEDDAVFETKAYSTDGDTNGELAYILDKGADWGTRTFDWTVADESYAVKNVLTDEILWEFPHKTIHNKLDTSAPYFEDYMNDNPVFKASVTDVEHGSLTLAGLGDTVTGGAASSIYNKEGSYLVADEQPDTGYVMMLVTEKQGANEPTDLPRMSLTYALSDYTISGYVLPHSDVLLSPVFTPYFTITGTLPHTTVTLSQTEAFENDTIYVSVVADSGYKVTDLKWNDNLFPTPYDSLSFTMPAANVVLTATVTRITAPTPPTITPSSEPKYFVDCEVTGEGTLDTSHWRTTAGTVVEVYTEASEGYKLISLTVDGTVLEDEFHSFVMPAHDVTVKAVFETTSDKPEIPTGPVLSRDCQIEFFSVAGFEGVIDDEANAIYLSIPENKKDILTSVVPDKIIWKGIRLSPDETTAIDLTSSPEYTVYAEDPTVTKTYKISVTWEEVVTSDDNSDTSIVPEEPVNPDTGFAGTDGLWAVIIVSIIVLATGVVLVTKKKAK